MMKRQLILLVLIGTMILSACSIENNRQSDESPVNVEVYSPKVSDENSLYISGTVTSSRQAIISTRMMGFVEKIHVKQGEHVNKGQLLVVINSNDLKAKRMQAAAMVEEAKAAVKNANLDYGRYKKLHDKNSVSDKELENIELNRISVESRLQMAIQSLNEIDAMLAYTDIRAPFSGIITQKLIDEGSTASPGMPLLVLEQPSDLEVSTSVSEIYMPYINLGDSVEVEIKSLEKHLSGIISEISPSSSFSGGQYSVKINLGSQENVQLFAGMYASIEIPVKNSRSSRKNIWIDTSSLVKREQLNGVYVVTPDNQAMLRWVRLGKNEGESVEVLSGLNESDRVIRLNGSKLYNGMKVNVTNKR